MYSIYQLYNAYLDNKNYIDSHLNNDLIENYKETKILGMSVTEFVITLSVYIILWIWGLTITILHWKHLHGIVKTLCVIGLIPIVPLGPVFTIILAHGEKI